MPPRSPPEQQQDFEVNRVTRGNQERDIERITTTEIKDVGSTKLDIPEDARKKLG